MDVLTDHPDVPSSPLPGVQPADMFNGEWGRASGESLWGATHRILPGLNEFCSLFLIINSHRALLAYACWFKNTHRG